MTKGIIFDWDGVLIDSSKAHEQSWERLAREQNQILPPGHFKESFGMKNEEIIPDLLQWTREKQKIREISLRKEQIYREIITEQGVPALKGAHELLVDLQKNRIPCAIGSSTHRLNITLALDLMEWHPYFKAILSSEDVELGKPNPDIFLKCARALGIVPENCVVIEDALVGIDAAKRGGMKVTAVATTNPVSDLQGADLVVESLIELNASRLLSLT